MQEKWNYFVYDLCEYTKRTVPFVYIDGHPLWCLVPCM